MDMKKDVMLAFLAGLVAGIFIFPATVNLDIKIPYAEIFLFVILPIGSAVFISLVKIIFKKSEPVQQVSKFIVAGGVNFSVDLGVLNLLRIYYPLGGEIWYAIFKSLSFIVANINSYFWNKGWTFEGGRSNKRGEGEYVKFFFVSLIGLGVNVLAAWLVVHFGPQKIASAILENIGVATGAIAGLLWNFIGYKFIVFNPKNG